MFEHLGLYLPDGSPLPRQMRRSLMGRVLECYHADESGMVYDVARAKRIAADPVVASAQRSNLPTSNPADLELDAERVRKSDPHIPGIGFVYWDRATRQPMYTLLDGNHRFRRAKEKGWLYFPVIVLSPEQARRCEWFYALPPGTAPLPVEYRDFFA